jgi:hypothetical protein
MPINSGIKIFTMRANDLIKWLDKGYAQNTGLVAANWVEDKEPGVDGQLSATPQQDALAYYLAAWANDRKLSGWFKPGNEKSNLHVLAALMCELDLAISDLEELFSFVRKVVTLDRTIKFFEMLQKRPRAVTPELLYVRSEVDAEDEEISICNPDIEDLIRSKLGEAINNPTVELCGQILAGLHEDRVALLGQKQETPEAAASGAVGVVAPELINKA